MGSKQSKVKVVKMRLRNGKVYNFPGYQEEEEAGTSTMSERRDLPVIVHRTQTNESASGAIFDDPMESMYTDQSVILNENSQFNPGREIAEMQNNQSDRHAEMQNNQSIGRACFLRIPIIYTGKCFLRIIYLIPSLMGIIGGINAIMDYIREPEVIVHAVHLTRPRSWLTDFLKSK